MNKILGPQESYIDLLDRRTLEIAEEYAKAPPLMPLRPSASGDCARALAFGWNEYLGNAKYDKQADRPEGQRIFAFGHSVEYHVLDQYYKAFKGTDWSVKYKQHSLLFFQLPNGEWVQGSLDAAFVSKEHKAIIDVKSKRDKFSDWMSTDWDAMNEQLRRNPHVQTIGDKGFYIDDLPAFLSDLDDPFLVMNFVQLNLYFFDSGNFLRNHGIDHASLLFYNKNDSRMREIRFRPSQDVFDYVKEKYLTIYDVIDKTKDPYKVDAEFSLGSVKCAFCNHNKRCHGEDTDPLKAYFKTLPEKFWSKKLENIEEPVQSQLAELYPRYLAALDNIDLAEKLEKDIIVLLEKVKVRKIKFDKNTIFGVESRKTGGIKNGPRKILKRTKD